MKVPRPAVKLGDDRASRSKITITNFDREAQQRSLASLKRKREKEKAKAMGLKGVRINAAGCLDRCELGPNLVIYPEGVWYHFDTKADATKGGVLKNVIGVEGGSVKIHKVNGRFDEERTFPGSKDPHSSKG